MDQFKDIMADVFEIDADDISLEKDFRATPEYEFDSLKGFAIICALEDEYGVQLSVDRFLECKTLGDIYAIAEKGE